MIKRILCYIAVFILTLYLFFMYDDTVMYTVLAVEIIYFLVSVASLLYLNKKISASLLVHSSIAEKNEEIPLAIRINNCSGFSAVYFDVVLRLENSFTGEKKKYRAPGKVGKKRDERLIVPIKIKECGNLKITLEKIIIYDYFFVLSKTIRVNDVGYIGILPESSLMPIEISRKTREFIADAEEYSDRESGDDASETYQIREYRMDDSIHDIHWKLSAKNDELLIKEKGRPLGAAVLIWLDLDKENEPIRKNNRFAIRKRVKNNRDMLTKVFDMTASISLSLLEEQCVHMVAWYEKENKVIHKKRISKEEHIYELLNRLMYVDNYDDSEAVKIQYEDAFRGIEFSTIVKIKHGGTVFVGDEKIEVPVNKGKILWKEFYLKV